jgi:fluoroacetyl-CoA thioesterase
VALDHPGARLSDRVTPHGSSDVRVDGRRDHPSRLADNRAMITAMRSSLTVGLAESANFEVGERHLVTHVPGGLLATPAMIAFIEYTCAAALVSHLDEGETTVGTHVCVSHDGAAWSGETISIRCRVDRIERRRVTFEVEVDSPRSVISRGTHERAVVKLARYAER